jgi:hypothetical protein
METGCGLLEFAPFPNGQVAQLVEQRTENPCVAGSIPALATNDFAERSEAKSTKG